MDLAKGDPTYRKKNNEQKLNNKDKYIQCTKLNYKQSDCFKSKYDMNIKVNG